MPLESSLLYTREDGRQEFVHDSYRDFFLAEALAERIQSAQLSPQKAYSMLKDTPQILGVLRVEQTGITFSLLKGIVVNEDTDTNLKWQRKVVKVRETHSLPPFWLVPVEKSLVYSVLPYLIGMLDYEKEFFEVLLADKPRPSLLAKCYIECCRNKDLETQVMDYLSAFLEANSDDFGVYQQSITTLKMLKSGYFLELIKTIGPDNPDNPYAVEVLESLMHYKNAN